MQIGMTLDPHTNLSKTLDKATVIQREKHLYSLLIKMGNKHRISSRKTKYLKIS